MSRTLIDRNSDTGKRSSQTSTCKRCDECLTARRSKLNGGFSRVADPALKAAALAMSRRARAFRRSHTCASKPAPKSRPLLVSTYSVESAPGEANSRSISEGLTPNIAAN
jgi:hypothetical protein